MHACMYVVSDVHVVETVHATCHVVNLWCIIILIIWKSCWSIYLLFGSCLGHVHQITDFGLSQLRSNSPSELLHQTAAVGTYHWMAPEVLMSQPYNEKVDVYSFGILLYEIFTQSIPYSSPPPPPSSSSMSQSPQFPAMQSPVNLALAVVQGLRPSISRIPRDCPPPIMYVKYTSLHVKYK